MEEEDGGAPSSWRHARRAATAAATRSAVAKVRSRRMVVSVVVRSERARVARCDRGEKRGERRPSEEEAESDRSSGARSAARRHGDPASSHVHRAGRGSWRGRAKFRDDDVSGDSTSSILRNAPGPIPGLVEHVDAVSGATKFRLVSFCNRAYWPFLRVALQSARAVAPDIVPYWTVLVPDEGTAEFVRDKAADVDVFVDDDLRAIVSDSVRQRNAGKFDGTSAGERAERAELRRLISWRRVHAMHGLLDAGYTAVFIEPDVVFAGDPRTC